MGTYIGEVKIVEGADKNGFGTIGNPIIVSTTSGSATGSAIDNALTVANVSSDHITATTADTYPVASTVAATALKILGVIATGSADTRVRLSSAATTISAFMTVNATNPLILPVVPNNGTPWFTGAAGEGINVEVDGGNMVGNSVTVTLVTGS